MNPLAPTAADTNHHGTVGFISVGSFHLCPGCCAIKRAPGVSFCEVIHGEER